MSNKRITQLPAKTTAIQAGDLFELAEVQPGGTFISKKLAGSQLITALPVGPQGPQGVAGPQGATGPQGPTGPTGPQGPTGPIGPAGLTWEGDWNASSSYTPNDVVYYAGGSYLCIDAVSGPGALNPAFDITNWSPLAAYGPQGIQGPAGANGATGPAGPAGPTGPTGPQGAVGPAGPQGIQGVAGPIGATGTQGPAGPVGPVSPGSFMHWIGEKYEGGTIAHLWKDSLGVEHGLILCENNVVMDGLGIPQTQGPLIPLPYTGWPSWPTGAPTSSTDGQANTSAIVAQFGSSNPYYGPYACDQLVYGGKSDWYLPSVFEMNAIRQNAFAINLAIQALGSGNEIYPDAQYWTSTFYSVNSALLVGGLYYLNFNGNVAGQNFVRAIRKF
jgi:hypothetical protein